MATSEETVRVRQEPDETTPSAIRSSSSRSKPFAKQQNEPAVATRRHGGKEVHHTEKVPSLSEVARNESLAVPVETDFLEWCRTALGIETILEIRTFEYRDYVQEFLNDKPMENDKDWWDVIDDDRIGDLSANNNSKKINKNETSAPLRRVRGLAASRPIAVGETVIRIPLHGLLSVTTTIDQDPFLSPIMGPEARKKYGWNLVPTVPETAASEDEVNNADDSAFLFELSLLAVALLYHRNMGDESPLVPYIQILEGSEVDSVPYLWSKEQWQSVPQSTGQGIRKVARGIRRDIRDMYKTVVQVLIEKHPSVFGRPTTEGGAEWIFSYPQFQWAFAIVNSRHWQLPIVDLDQEGEWMKKSPPSTPKPQVVVEGQVPPADMPTESFVKREHDEDVDTSDPPKDRTESTPIPSLEHSFLAPVADLLNFGPSCTESHYDVATHTFEIIASCPFTKGQEVTFWYSDECEDVMMGMYGFLHPLVPPCLSAEEYRSRGEAWRRRAELLEKQLDQAYNDLDHVHDELEEVEEILEGCDCCGDHHRPSSSPSRKGGAVPTGLRHHENGNFRGARVRGHGTDLNRHGILERRGGGGHHRKRATRRSEF